MYYKGIKCCYTVAKQWFINNHPLVQYWEQNNIKWCMHHWDTSLRKNNPDRYNLWIIDDLVPMTFAWHRSMHMKNNPNNRFNYGFCGEQNGMYDVHRFGSDNPNYGHHTLKGVKKPDGFGDKVSAYQKGRPKSLQHRLNLSSPVVCVELDKKFNSIKDAKSWLGKGDISYALKYNKTAGGYHWGYYTQEEDN